METLPKKVRNQAAVDFLAKVKARDDEGFLYRVDDSSGQSFYFRVSECCWSAATCDEWGTVVCRNCHKEINPRIGQEPVLKVKA